MNIADTLNYLREKGIRYLYQGQNENDQELITRARAYLKFANDLDQKVNRDVV